MLSHRLPLSSDECDYKRGFFCTGSLLEWEGLSCKTSVPLTDLMRSERLQMALVLWKGPGPM